MHLFTGIHYVLDSKGPTRVMATGGLRFWNDGRDVPDVMLGLYDYPKTGTHPAFTLALKVNFAEGAGENQAFRFVGPEGVLTIGGNSVTLAKNPRPKEPGYTIDTFPLATQQAILKEYSAKYPFTPELRPGTEEVFAAPGNYYDGYDHFVTFFNAMRSRKPVTEDAVFGFRAAAPALLTNDSYFEGQPIELGSRRMKRDQRGESESSRWIQGVEVRVGSGFGARSRRSTNPEPNPEPRTRTRCLFRKQPLQLLDRSLAAILRELERFRDSGPSSLAPGRTERSTARGICPQRPRCAA